jgi:putative lipoprotein
MTNRPLAVVVCACALLLGCGTDSTDHASAGGPSAAAEERERVLTGEIVRGHVTYGHEVRTIRPCGSDDAAWAVDDSTTLWTLHQELTPNVQPYEELFVVVEGSWGPPPADGFGSDHPEALHVDRVLYAGLEGPACDADWDRFDFRALGNEPSWSAVAATGTIRLSRMGQADQLWTMVTREAAGEGVRYASDGDATLGPIELLVTVEPCRDTMSGAYFAFSATLRLDSEELRGCALLGMRPAG